MEQLSERITRCPKCGGTSGYEGILTMRYVMTGAWGQEWETSGDEEAIYRSKSMKCADCKGRISSDVATGATAS